MKTNVLVVSAMFYDKLPEGAELMLRSAEYHGIEVMHLPPIPEASVGKFTIDNEDQLRWIAGYAAGRIPMTVDHQCRLGFAFHGTDGRLHVNKDIVWGKRHRFARPAVPCTFHANGPEKWRLKEVWEMLVQ